MIQIGKSVFDDNKTHIMGILNITDNSFSDGGKYLDIDKALFRAEQMIGEGAEIIDVGGESTRPGYIKISDDEEISRVVPVIERLKQSFDVPISIDTYKSGVLIEAAKAGADMANDIWGFKYDKAMASVAAKYNMSACLMHNRENTDYTDFINDVISDLQESIEISNTAGVKNIIIDPGVGFAKSYEQNLEVIKDIGKLKKLGCPLLLGASNKSVIGLTLNKEVDKRLYGTLATTAYAVMSGCAFVRVHNVAENMDVIQMTERILGK